MNTYPMTASATNPHVHHEFNQGISPPAYPGAMDINAINPQWNSSQEAYAGFDPISHQNWIQAPHNWDSLAQPWQPVTQYPNITLQASGPPQTKPKTNGRKKPKRIRTGYTTNQLRHLEKEFVKDNYINKPRRLELSRELEIGEKQVKIWFQNRRMKAKNERMELMDDAIESSVGSTSGSTSDEYQMQTNDHGHIHQFGYVSDQYQQLPRPGQQGSMQYAPVTSYQTGNLTEPTPVYHIQVSHTPVDPSYYQQTKSSFYDQEASSRVASSMGPMFSGITITTGMNTGQDGVQPSAPLTEYQGAEDLMLPTSVLDNDIDSVLSFFT